MNSIASCTATKNILVSLTDALNAFPQDWEVIIDGAREILTTQQLNDSKVFLRSALPHYFIVNAEEVDGKLLDVFVEVHTPETADWGSMNDLTDMEIVWLDGKPLTECNSDIFRPREEHAGQHFYDPTPLEG
jgi:hypothetical protein